MPNAKSFTRTQRDTAAQNLAALPEKPASEHRLSTRDMVKSIQAHILAAQKKGYTFEEIADVISKAGVRVSVGTLKYALRVVAEEKKHSQVSGGSAGTGNAQSSRKRAGLTSPVRNGQSHVAPPLREREKLNKPSITPIRGTFGFPISPDTENL
ncbi:hypothetical protein [Paraburkholderia lycopersici]|uniref:Uncharacterized protein n=1 Tax=Paraburkholderia lycopersici TaxID=416944 RepID=A0A1G6UB74_9BURK|nr:hypothetical protein [Paraburkholderia lycopersici]SDD37837.1 hypothetical protein SAMN05421548_118117 [Paraburkholderia lycopersici]